jgi:hypothetical protein
MDRMFAVMAPEKPLALFGHLHLGRGVMHPTLAVEMDGNYGAAGRHPGNYGPGIIPFPVGLAATKLTHYRKA